MRQALDQMVFERKCNWAIDLSNQSYPALPAVSQFGLDHESIEAK
jgi:hypothetical protein